MTKIIISIIALYLLYYAGNVIYDLFLDKDGSKKQNEPEEYSLKGFAEINKDEIREVGIDDVENINTPNSFSKKELSQVTDEEQNESWDLDQWRQRFESEQDIDSFDSIPEIEENNQETQEVFIPQQDENAQSATKNDDLLQKHRLYQNQFYQFLSLAETSIQVISDRNGYKVYQSMI